MEIALMSLEDARNGSQRMIARAQDWHFRDGEMLPGNKRQQGRSNRTENLRDQNDVFAADPVGQMSRRERQTDNRNCEDEPDRAEPRRRMGAPINLPFHRDREHLPAEDRQQISGGEKTKPARAKGGIRVVFRRRRNYRTANLRALADRRIVFV